MQEVKKFFKPEFLNRLDDIIVFHYLERDQLRAVARMFVDDLIQRMTEQGIELTVSDGVVNKLAADGFSPGLWRSSAAPRGRTAARESPRHAGRAGRL